MARGWWQRPCRGYGDEAAPRVYDRPPPRGHSPPPWLFRDGYTNRDPRGWCSGRNGGSSSPSTASFITKVRSPPSFSTEITCRLVSLSSKDFSISFSFSLSIFFYASFSSFCFLLLLFFSLEWHKAPVLDTRLVILVVSFTRIHISSSLLFLFIFFFPFLFSFTFYSVVILKPSEEHFFSRGTGNIRTNF